MGVMAQIGRDIREKWNKSRKFLVSDIMRKAFYVFWGIEIIYILILCIEWTGSASYVFSLDKFVIAGGYFMLIYGIGVGLAKHFSGKRNVGTIIFLFSMLLNFLIILLAGQNTHQIYDYKTAYDSSFQNIGDFSLKSTVFPNWAMYPIYLKVINAIFGSNELTGISFNGLIVSLSACMLYYIAKRFVSEKISISAALIFSAWPSFLGYIVILSPEYVFVFLMMLSALLFIKAYSSDSPLCRYAGAFGGGLTLALSNFFKTVVPVILVALVLTIFFLFLDHRKEIIVCFRKTNRKCVINKLAITAVAILTFAVSGAVGNSALETFYGRDLNPSPHIFYMTMGLSSESKGFYNRDIQIEYVNRMQETDFDFETVNGEFYSSLKADLKENDHINYNFFKNKIMYSFGNDDYSVLVDLTIDEEHSVLALTSWRDFFVPFNQYWYIICVVMIVFSAFRNFVVNDNKLIFISSLIIFGFIILLMFSEVQPRYKCIFYPILSLLAADGLDSVRCIGNYLCSLKRAKKPM